MINYYSSCYPDIILWNWKWKYFLKYLDFFWPDHHDIFSIQRKMKFSFTKFLFDPELMLDSCHNFFAQSNTIVCTVCIVLGVLLRKWIVSAYTSMSFMRCLGLKALKTQQKPSSVVITLNILKQSISWFFQEHCKSRFLHCGILCIWEKCH